MDDSQIIKLFLVCSEKEISELSPKYGGVCMKIAQNVLNNYQSAEGRVNDTYLLTVFRIRVNHKRKFG